MIKYAIYFLTLAAVFIGCQESVDVEKPTVIIELPAENGIVTTNDNLRLVATLSDNTGLLQYKMTLKGIDELNDIGADSTYSIIYIDGFSDRPKTLFFDEVYELADSTFNGFYRLTLSCIDVEGNESIRDTVEFQIQNSIDSESPIFNVGGPNRDTLTIGNGFSPTGIITDSQSLIYASIYIGRTDGSDTLHWFDFPSIENNEVSFETGQGWYVVDSTWTQGSYHLYFTAWDNYSGVSHEIPFQVKY